MANKMLFAALAVICGFGLVEGCRGGGGGLRPGRFPFAPGGRKPRPGPHNYPGGGDDRNSRFLPNPSSELIYLGSADNRAYYAALNLPMDWAAAFDFCTLSNMNLASSHRTDKQNELLATVISDAVVAFGIAISDSPIRFWTLSDDLDLGMGQCGTVSVSGNDMISGQAQCSDTVELTICDTDDYNMVPGI